MIQYLLLLDTEEEKTLFEKIYMKYRDEMYYTAYTILENKHDAEDIVHESFVALLDNMDKITGNRPERTWNYIVTIVKNKAYNLYNKKKRHEEEALTDNILSEEGMLDDDLEVKMMEVEKREFLVEYIKCLPESYREVLILKYYYGMKGPEIAKVLGKTVDNVRHMLMRAKKKLVELMEENGYSGEE